ncbi:unnamed protein product (macronuclear) [Paramecium tetraurelia]|uniref:Uncharacterized protein n=1 Tax=Paramecium tetraurelia TaxID=5888 RepID=A0C557_PARTE|nr:uncharacterized protein GSPATT00006423001 [Paramecium tetraurelia]CAK65924.1 unnamed protein product [Paramecium tetraurelia]|eukprot:XP_001433321.1 hypothetical protein (macronuclear) [Paramecium tetraurelia strain d4-2]
MKVIEEIKYQVELEMKKKFGKCIEKRYAKITDDLKEECIQNVIQKGKTIREVSQQLSINYSSAKSILANYRKSQNGIKVKYHLEPRQVKVNDEYDWKKFKIQTYCEDRQVNEYTMDTFAQIVKQPSINNAIN